MIASIHPKPVRTVWGVICLLFAAVLVAGSVSCNLYLDGSWRRPVLPGSVTIAYDCEDTGERFLIETGETVPVGTTLIAVYTDPEDDDKKVDEDDISYQWLLNGKPIDGETGDEIIAEEPGKYTVSVRAEGYRPLYSYSVLVGDDGESPPGGQWVVIRQQVGTGGIIDIVNGRVPLGTTLVAVFTGPGGIPLDLPWQWRRDNSQSSTATDGIYTPTTEGSYTVEVYAAGHGLLVSAPVRVGDDTASQVCTCSQPNITWGRLIEFPIINNSGQTPAAENGEQEGTCGNCGGTATRTVQWDVTTLAGNGTTQLLNSPTGIAVHGNIIYVADTENHRIQKIDAAGNVTTLAGSTLGFAEGQGTQAQFRSPTGIAVHGNIIYVTDTGNHRIRRIDAAGNVTTLAGSGTASGFQDGQGTQAQFASPTGIAVDAAGIIYVADGNSRIRRIDINNNNDVTTPVSTGLNELYGVAVHGNIIYVANRGSHIIQRIELNNDNAVTTLVGSTQGFTEGQGTAARFARPAGIAVHGNIIYVADTDNHRIRRIDAAGNVTTLAGLGGNGGFIDGQGTQAQFRQPRGIAVDAAGNIYIADSGNHRIRKMSLVSVP
jgi:sugar lactone lactonase YvrE